VDLPTFGRPTREITGINHAQSTYTQQADFIMAKQAVNQGNYQDALNYLLPLTNSTNEFKMCLRLYWKTY
jgi:predicted negative regulator of RcsB-dependent stress response